MKNIKILMQSTNIEDKTRKAKIRDSIFWDNPTIEVIK